MAEETQMPNGITKATDNSKPSGGQWSEFLVNLTKQNVDEIKKIGGSLEDYTKYFKSFEDVKKNTPAPDEEDFTVPLDATGKVPVADPGLKVNTEKLTGIHSVLQSIDKHLGVSDKLKAISQPLVSRAHGVSDMYGSTLGSDSPGLNKNLAAAGEKALSMGSTLTKTSLDLAMAPIQGILKPFEDMFKFSTSDLMMKGLSIPGTTIKKQLAKRKTPIEQVGESVVQTEPIAPPVWEDTTPKQQSPEPAPIQQVQLTPPVWEDTTPEPAPIQPAQSAPLQLMPPESKPVSDGFDMMSVKDQDIVTRPDNWPSVFETPNSGEGDALGLADKTADFLDNRMLPKENVLLRDGGVIGASAVYIAEELAKLAGGGPGDKSLVSGGDGDGDGSPTFVDNLTTGATMSAMTKYGLPILTGLASFAGTFAPLIPGIVASGALAVLTTKGLKENWSQQGAKTHDDTIATITDPEATLSEKAAAVGTSYVKTIGGTAASVIEAGRTADDKLKENRAQLEIDNPDNLSPIGATMFGTYVKDKLAAASAIPKTLFSYLFGSKSKEETSPKETEFKNIAAGFDTSMESSNKKLGLMDMKSLGMTSTGISEYVKSSDSTLTPTNEYPLDGMTFSQGPSDETTNLGVMQNARNLNLGKTLNIAEAPIFNDSPGLDPLSNNLGVLPATEPTGIDKSMVNIERPLPQPIMTKQDSSGEKSLNKFDSMIEQLQEITKVLKDKNFSTSINSSYQAAPDFSQVRV